MNIRQAILNTKAGAIFVIVVFLIGPLIAIRLHKVLTSPWQATLVEDGSIVLIHNGYFSTEEYDLVIRERRWMWQDKQTHWHVLVTPFESHFTEQMVLKLGNYGDIYLCDRKTRKQYKVRSEYGEGWQLKRDKDWKPILFRDDPDPPERW